MNIASLFQEHLPYMKKWCKQLYIPIKRQSLPLLLGRWKLYQDDKTIYNRVDLANHDHCGTCQYNSLLNSKQKNQTIVTKIDNH